MTRVALLKSQARCELYLSGRPKLWLHERDKNLRRLGVQVFAKSLKVRTQMQHEPTEGLVQKSGIGWNERLDRGAMIVHFAETEQAISPPSGEGSGGHWESRLKTNRHAVEMPVGVEVDREKQGDFRSKEFPGNPARLRLGFDHRTKFVMPLNAVTIENDGLAFD